MPDRFVRLPNAYGHAGGSRVRLQQYELRGEAPANCSDPLEATKNQLAHALRGDDTTQLEEAAGDLLARIWTAFGPPDEGKPDEQFYYTFLDTQTGVVFSVESREAGSPRYTLAGSYDGALPPAAEPSSHFRADSGAQTGLGLLSGLNSLLSLVNLPRLAEPQTLLRQSASAFDAFVGKQPRADCTLMVNTDFGLHRIGAQADKVVDGKASFTEAIDFYVELVERHGPTRNIPAANLAAHELQIFLLWLKATDSERAERPDAIQYAGKGWQNEVRKLSERIVLESRERAEWSHVWSMLARDAARVGMDTAEGEAALERVREPPGAPRLSTVELEALRSALWARNASPNWSENERRQHAAFAQQTAARGPEYDPVQIVARLTRSPDAPDRHAAERLQRVLFA